MNQYDVFSNSPVIRRSTFEGLSSIPSGALMWSGMFPYTMTIGHFILQAEKRPLVVDQIMVLLTQSQLNDFRKSEWVGRLY